MAILVVHVLRVAGINNDDGVAFDTMGIIPFVGVGHEIAFPSGDCWLAPWQRSFYGIDIKDSVTNVSLHVFIRISMAILQSNVLVECPDFLYSPLGINVLILHP